MEENGVSPPSPEVSPVQLSGCIEDLVKFVLQCAVNGDDLRLSAEFCSGLLKDEDKVVDDSVRSSNSQSSPQSDLSEGVRLYPLYKHLASALKHWIVSGSFFSPCENALSICEDDSLKPIKDKWNELVSQKGPELVTMLKSVKFRLHVQEPFFSQLKDGQKTIEGRCATGDYTLMQSGDLILFNNCLMLEVQDVHHYASFVEMLEAESLEKVLPGVLSIEEA
uniref:ASCH domain-containing protein n=1 Tax=Opuntia streptacantha TaxID=393608 RepID=A0A7C9EJZ7_OPUST